MRATHLPAPDPIRRRLESLDRRPGAGEPLWLRRRRQEARQAARAGLPGPEDEEWRETSLRALAETPFGAPPPGAEPPAEPCPELGRPHLVFVDGRADAAPCAAPPPGLFVGGLGRALAEKPEAVEPHLARVAPGAHPLAALNTALFEDAAVVVVPPGAVATEPLLIVHAAGGAEGPTVRFPRTLIVAGEGAQVSVIEIHTGRSGPGYWSCPVTELVAGDGAVVRLRVLQLEGAAAFHTAVLQGVQGRGSGIEILHAAFGAALSRADVGVRMEGEGANCRLDGLYVGRGTQHLDAHTTIDHAAPHGTSHELFKGILADAAGGVFKGRIIVRPGAQKTDAVQHNGNLLLTRDAKVNTRPQLEIHADDVRCTHGATIGRLDEDALFYMRSRGLPQREARRMLIRAFAAEVLDRVESGPLRDRLSAELDRRVEEVER
ncbi:MAG: Fe-S cluster assembly protein SufD [Acidobacteria bacterium]|nr:MAG: Fe-S cluster assembly protein SufD [Acidobacteriota bacterium]